jgi:hypothetical protein
MDSKLLEAAFKSLDRWPIVQLAFAALILTIAVTMIMKGLREKPPATAPPPPLPIQVESPWLLIEIERIKTQCQAIERSLTDLHRRFDILMGRRRRRLSRNVCGVCAIRKSGAAACRPRRPQHSPARRSVTRPPNPLWTEARSMPRPGFFVF